MLRCVPYPLHDIMVAAKNGTDKVDLLWKQIQDALQRNMSLSSMSPSLSGTTSPTMRLMQQGESMTTTAQHQLLDRLVIQVNEAIRSLQRQGNETKSNEIETARHLLADAHGAKQVRVILFDVLALQLF